MTLLETPTGLLTVLTTAITLGYIGYGIYVYRTYDQVGTGSLSLFSCMWGLNFLVSSVVVFVLLSAGIESGLELRGIAFSRPSELFLLGSTAVRGVLTVGAIFAWFWFVTEYTTRPRRRDDLVAIGFGVVLTVVAALNGFVGALAAFGYIQLPAILQGGFFRFASLLEILGTGIGIGVGTAQLLRTARNHPPFKLGAAVALTTPVIFPYLLRYLYQFGIIPDFQTVQLLRFVTLLGGLCGLLLATSRYDLFDQLPAAQVLGRERSFEKTSTAIAVLDDNNTIADVNGAARSLFDVDGTAAIGAPLDAIVPHSDSAVDLSGEATHTFEIPDSGTIVESETTITTDGRGRDFGKVIVFKDITAERRQRQRIQVLNRVLRHNLRNSLMVAYGQIDQLSRDDQSTEENITHLEQTLEELLEMGVKAGQVETVLKTEPKTDTARPLADLVRMSLEELDGDLTRVETTLEASCETTASPVVVQSILTELITNAIQHTDEGAVTVSLTEDGTGVTVSDTGSGIPENEAAVFATGEETPLQHGHGLGLWMVKWGSGLLGASFALETDSNGTKTTIRLPSSLVVERPSVSS